jgi:carbamate kinase
MSYTGGIQVLTEKKVAVVALGGNAISPPGEVDTIPNQFQHTRESLGSIVELVREGYQLVITHGNGPQVGNAMLRVEMTRGKAPELPIGVCVADIAGGMGYMIDQSLQNRLNHEGIDREVATVITQVVVDADDPSMENPGKYVGAHYSEEDARALVEEMNWNMKQDGKLGMRRVVSSPVPRNVVSAGIVRRLVESGIIVITAGGGGIPVYIEGDGSLEGVDAVIDKDRTAAVLGTDIGAKLLVILTDVRKVAVDYGTEKQNDLDEMSMTQAVQYLKDGQFPPGNMGPKIEAAIGFLKNGGERVVIASISEAYDAVEGMAGTQILSG